MERIICLLAAFLLVGSCSSDSQREAPVGGDWMQSSSYIVHYADGEFAIAADPIRNSDYWDLSFVPASVKLYYAPESMVCPDTWETFGAIARRNGDTQYNGLLNEYEMNAVCFADNFTSIRFRSDRDWDGAHPAGTPLDDLVTVMLSSYAPFVRSGYDRKAPGLSQWGPYAFYQLHADRLTADQMAMVAWEGIGFYFDTAPDDPSQEHTLTVTLETVDGEQITVTARGIPPWGAYEPIG